MKLKPLFHDGQNIGLLYDGIVLAVQLDFGAGVLAHTPAVAGLTAKVYPYFSGKIWNFHCCNFLLDALLYKR